MARPDLPPDNRELHDALDALPLVGSEHKTLDNLAAMAAFFELKKTNPNLARDISKLYERLYAEALTSAERVPGHPGVLAFRAQDLRAVLAGVAMRAATQTAYDIGGSLAEANQLRRAIEELFTDPGVNDDDAGSQPAV